MTQFLEKVINYFNELPQNTKELINNAIIILLIALLLIFIILRLKHYIQGKEKLKECKQKLIVWMDKKIEKQDTLNKTDKEKAAYIKALSDVKEIIEEGKK